MATQNASFVTPEAAIITSIDETLLYVFFGIISFLSITGNAVVCFVFHFESEIFGSITNILILNQSIIDLCSGVIFALLKFAPVVSYNSITWFSVVCYAWISEYPFWSLSYASTFNLLLLSVERYFAICHSLKHRKLFTKHMVKGYCAIVWFAGFSIQIYLPVVHHIESIGRCKFEFPNKATQIFVGTFVFATEYLIPLIMMTLAYISIWWNLKNRMKSKNKDTVKAISKGKRNVTITLCLVFISYVICWSPDAVVFFYFNLGSAYNFQSIGHHIVMVLVLGNMCTNPCIYAFKYDRFRQQLKSLICRGTFANMSKSHDSTLDGNNSSATDSVPNKKDYAVQVVSNREQCRPYYLRDQFVQTEEQFV